MLLFFNYFHYFTQFLRFLCCTCFEERICHFLSVSAICKLELRTGEAVAMGTAAHPSLLADLCSLLDHLRKIASCEFNFIFDSTSCTCKMFFTTSNLISLYYLCRLMMPSAELVSPLTTKPPLPPSRRRRPAAPTPARIRARRAMAKAWAGALEPELHEEDDVISASTSTPVVEFELVDSDLEESTLKEEESIEEMELLDIEPERAPRPRPPRSVGLHAWSRTASPEPVAASPPLCWFLLQPTPSPTPSLDEFERVELEQDLLAPTPRAEFGALELLRGGDATPSTPSVHEDQAPPVSPCSAATPSPVDDDDDVICSCGWSVVWRRPGPKPFSRLRRWIRRRFGRRRGRSDLCV